MRDNTSGFNKFLSLSTFSGISLLIMILMTLSHAQNLEGAVYSGDGPNDPKTADSTIYILNDSTGGDCASIGTWDYDTLTCTLDSDITFSFPAGGYAIDLPGNVTLDGNSHQISGTDQTGVGIRPAPTSTIKNLTIRRFSGGISAYGSAGTILNNYIEENGTGISVVFWGAPTTTIAGNTIENNNTAIHTFRSSVTAYNNNIYDKVEATGSFNLPAPVGGNYWGEGQDSNNDGFVDYPFAVYSWSDYYGSHVVYDNLPWARENGWHPDNAPIAANDIAVTDEDVPVAVAILANDQDADGPGTLEEHGTISIVQAPQFGTAKVNPDNTVTYKPDRSFSGQDTFTYTVILAGRKSKPATVAIIVNPVDDAPVATDDAATTDEDIAAEIDVLANDTDIDGPGEITEASITIVDAPAMGSAQIGSGGKILYTPDPDQSGADSLTYTASLGGAVSNVATVAITVNPVDDAPMAGDDAATTDEDMPVTVAVLANDQDIDGPGTLQADGVINIVQAPQQGSATINPDKTITYTPDADTNGEDSLIYTVTLGGLESNPATVAININPVDDAPVATGDTTTTDEDVTAEIDVLANDTDIDGPGEITGASITIVDAPAMGSAQIGAGGKILYTPDPNQSGADSFTYTASLGGAVSNVATVSITVNPVNDAPVSADDAAATTILKTTTIDVLANDTDIDGPGDLAEAVIIRAPALGATATGGAKVTFSALLPGKYTFTYKARDKAGLLSENEATVTVTVGLSTSLFSSRLI